MRTCAFAITLGLLGVGSARMYGADAPVLYSDNFATLRPEWGQANEEKSVSGNKLILNTMPNLIRQVLFGENRIENADIRVKVALVTGNTDQVGGITFWATNLNDCYVACVTADGRFYVGRRMHGRRLNPVALQARDEVLKGLDQVNELRVVTSGRSATVYVNDKQMVTIKGYPPAGPSRFGLYVEAGTELATWAFSEWSVHEGPVPPAPQGPQDDSLLLADDFSTFDPAWGTADETDSVSGGKMTVTLQARLEHRNFYQGSLFENADIRINVAETAGGADAPGGIIFWGLNHKNYYLALVWSDGTFLVARKVNGKWLRPVLPKVRDEVLKGLGQVNQLRVATSGRTATLYINGKQAVAIKGFPPAGGGLIGIHAESGAEPYTWAYSQLSVHKAPAPPETQSPQDNAVLFADDFSTLDPSWGDTSDMMSASGNKLILKPPANSTFTNLYGGALFEDADIRVKMAQTGGNLSVQTERGTATVTVPSGLVFWATDASHYYKALINPSGLFLVARYAKGAEREFEQVLPMKELDAVHRGVGKVNEIRIVTKGKSGTAYVNDQLVGTFEGSPPEGGSKIGLQAKSGEDVYIWEFSDFSVRKPE